MPSIRGSSVSRTRRLLSRSGSFFPVSIHQPLQHLVPDALAVVDQPLDRVGDLELAAGRRLDRRDGVVDVGVEEVDADDREVGRRVGRLLDQLHDLAVGAEHRDAELAGVVDVGEQDLRVTRTPPSARPGRVRTFGLEALDELLQTLLQHVVAEVHDEVVVAEEVAGDQDAVGEPERRVLADVRDLDAPTGSRRRRPP